MNHRAIKAFLENLDSSIDEPIKLRACLMLLKFHELLEKKQLKPVTPWLKMKSYKSF